MGWSLANKCFLCHNKEESIDHILVHGVKTRVLWWLLFSIFGMTWVLSSMGRETLLSWHVLLWAKNLKKVWKAALLHIFCTIWEERNKIAFENGEVSNQRLKYSFVCNLWLWTKLFIDDDLLSLIKFIDWLGSRWGQVFFFFCNPSFLLVLSFGDQCMLLVYFRMFSWRFLLIYTLLFYWSSGGNLICWSLVAVLWLHCDVLKGEICLIFYFLFIGDEKFYLIL